MRALTLADAAPGPSGAARSTLANVAYETLSDPSRRAAYLAKQQQQRRGVGRGGRTGAPPSSSSSVRSRPGVVGPQRSALVEAVPLTACGASGSEACDADAVQRLAHSLRQWLATLPFTTEVPLPLPVQVDALPDGVRVAFIAASSTPSQSGRLLSSVGELLFVFTVDGADEPSVAVTRTWPDGSGEGDGRPLPGEERLLEAFRREVAFLQCSDGGGADCSAPPAPFALPAWLSFVFAALPVGLGMGGAGGGEYSAYNLRPGAPGAGSKERTGGAGEG